VESFGRHLSISVGLVNGLQVVRTPEGRGGAVVIGHPLWRHDESHWNTQVRDAVAELSADGVGHVKVSDTVVIDRTPMKIFSSLLDTN
jgi:DEAD/DEAH box helicase domain-containing protein